MGNIGDDRTFSSQKSKTTSFRIDSFVLSELQRDANQNEISLNILVNKILKEYIEWGKYERKLGLIPVPKILLSSLIHEAMILIESTNTVPIKSYRDRLIKHAAEITFSNIKDCVIVMKKKLDFWSILSVLEEYMKVSGINSDHRVESERKHIFVIQHDLGEYWSYFAKELLILIFSSIGHENSNIYTTTNSVIAELYL